MPWYKCRVVELDNKIRTIRHNVNLDDEPCALDDIAVSVVYSCMSDLGCQMPDGALMKPIVLTVHVKPEELPHWWRVNAADDEYTDDGFAITKITIGDYRIVHAGECHNNSRKIIPHE